MDTVYRDALSEKTKDRVFAAPQPQIADFNFGEGTAAVFDDMLDRSVPFYSEIQRMVGELAADYATDGSHIYDLGCSTCNTFMTIAPRLPDDVNVRFIGIDASEPMLDQAREKLTDTGFPYPFELQRADLNDGLVIENASVVLMVLTLQFVRPLYRNQIIAEIYRGLNKNGCLILVEKVLGESSTFNRLFITHYYEKKKRAGYSELEISQKREALENVLVPYRYEENKKLLQQEGFDQVDIFFKWYNFSAIIAQK